jgi:phosphate transport system ATP-binding protein
MTTEATEATEVTDTAVLPVVRAADANPAVLEARAVSAWFGTHKVLERVSLTMPAGEVTSLIGPSGCGKSTFLRILNRMHEMIPAAALSGEVLFEGEDIYAPGRRLTDARRQIGMVFQKPNPFPAMSIYDNVLAGLKLTGIRASRREKDELVEECLTRGGLWKEVRDRLRQPGGALSGGQRLPPVRLLPRRTGHPRPHRRTRSHRRHLRQPPGHPHRRLRGRPIRLI